MLMPRPVPMSPPDAGKSEDAHSPTHDFRPSMMPPVPVPMSRRMPGSQKMTTLPPMTSGLRCRRPMPMSRRMPGSQKMTSLPPMTSGRRCRRPVPMSPPGADVAAHAELFTKKRTMCYIRIAR